ncbi:MAG: FliI/YscN family ATPase [Pseudomonadales bacterium]|nr:FliI/YscN family ATPase [Pseudomonadales bacterium]
MLKQLQQYQSRLEDFKVESVAKGRLIRVRGMMLEAAGCRTSIGGICHIIDGDNATEVEVVGFDAEKILMMPVGPVGKLTPGAAVVPVAEQQIGVGDAFLGRVVDGNGKPLDGAGDIQPDRYVPLHQTPINPLFRQPISTVLDTGIGAINSMITVGRGQRLGLFAGSGVGKSVLLGMMTRHTEADVIVVGLIGERGREVKEFIDNILDARGRARAVIVAAPADDLPTMKIRGAELASRLAEDFRDRGKHVLLLMDSITRYAQAQRQISLALGEPPSTKGYPPTVFAKIPELVERAGNGLAEGGSITAFYTVLTEGDDLQDPVADSARAILDGHVVLSRRLAEAGHYPAIDIEASVSRTMPNIVTDIHMARAKEFRQVYAKYRHNEDLITVGAYTAGSDSQLDYAIEKFAPMGQFLQQGINQQLRLEESLEQLEALFAGAAVADPKPL